MASCCGFSEKRRLGRPLFARSHPEREAWLHFSYPLLEAEYGFFVSRDNVLNYRKPEDVSGYRVGAYGPSNTADRLKVLLKKAQNHILEIRPDDESGFKKLEHGRLDAVFSNKVVGETMIRRLDLKNIRYAGTDASVLYYYAFSKKVVPKAVLGKFNSTYMEFYRTGIIEKVLNEHGLKPFPIE